MILCKATAADPVTADQPQGEFMKIGIMTETYTKTLGFEPGLRMLRDDGWECVDYSDFQNVETPKFLCSDAEFDATIRREHALLESLGLTVSQAHAPWPWPCPDGVVADWPARLEKFSRAIRGAAMLGCRHFVIHPLMNWETSRPEDPAAVRGANMEYAASLCDIASACHVVICLENMPFKELCLSTPEACLGFVRELGRPNLKICLDTGHCTMFGISPGAAVRMLGHDMLATLHVHDNDGTTDSHSRPGAGVIDWTDFAAALREIGFDGVVSLENVSRNGDDAGSRREWVRTALRLAARE